MLLAMRKLLHLLMERLSNQSESWSPDADRIGQGTVNATWSNQRRNLLFEDPIPTVPQIDEKARKLAELQAKWIALKEAK